MNRPITVVAGCTDPTRSYISTEIGYAVSHGVDFLLKHKSAASSWPTTIIKLTIIASVIILSVTPTKFHKCLA